MALTDVEVNSVSYGDDQVRERPLNSVFILWIDVVDFRMGQTVPVMHY